MAVKKFKAGDLKGQTLEGVIVLLTQDTPYKQSVTRYTNESFCCKRGETTHWDLREAKKDFFNTISHRRIVYRYNGKKWEKVAWLDINLR